MTSISRLFQMTPRKRGLTLLGGGSLWLLTAAGCSAHTAPTSEGAATQAASLTAADLAIALANDVSPSRDEWVAIASDATKQDLFWNHILPESVLSDSPPAYQTVANIFWYDAVPYNWAWQYSGIPGWPWGQGGYFTQELWAKYIPLGKILSQSAQPKVHDYYADTFWEHAVPEGWATVPNIGGWYTNIDPPIADGYYKQWLWLRAIPDDWGPAHPSFPLVEGAPTNYYKSTFYHDAVFSDYAKQDALGEGYYNYYLHESYFMSNIDGHAADVYEHLRYIENAGPGADAPAAPVNEWFAPDAHAVVIFTFDEEAPENKGRAVRDVLRGFRRGTSVTQDGTQDWVPATFFIPTRWWNPGGPFVTNDPAGPGPWQYDIGQFDLGNHTVHHDFLARLAYSAQSSELADARGNISLLFPDWSPNGIDSVRAPFCDGSKSFDRGVVTAEAANLGTWNGNPVVVGDSSVGNVGSVARSHDLVPTTGLARSMISDYPFPYALTSPSASMVIEFPFTYPSDGALLGFSDKVLIHERKQSDEAWSKESGLYSEIFDTDIYPRFGTMVVLMHQHIEASSVPDNGPGNLVYPDSLAETIDYIRSRSSDDGKVYFTDMKTATRKFACHYYASALAPGTCP